MRDIKVARNPKGGEGRKYTFELNGEAAIASEIMLTDELIVSISLVPHGKVKDSGEVMSSLLTLTPGNREIILKALRRYLDALGAGAERLAERSDATPHESNNV